MKLLVYVPTRNAYSWFRTWDFEVLLVVENIHHTLPSSDRCRWADERRLAEVEVSDSTTLLHDLEITLHCGEWIQSVHTVGSVPAGECSHEQLVHNPALGNIEIRTRRGEPIQSFISLGACLQ